MAKDTEQEISRLNRTVVQLYQLGRYEEAIAVAARACNLVREHLGEDHPDFASSLNHLAALYRAMGNFAAAEPLHRQVLEIRRRVLGEDHPNFAISLNNLAALYQAMGNFAAAEPLHHQALALYRRVLGEEHPNVATSLNNLALLYRSMGNYAEALPLYQQALALYRRVLGEEHPDVASSLNNLAVLYVATAREKGALTLMEQAASIKDKMIGQVFSIGSESQRTAYLKTVEGDFDTFLSLVFQHLSASPAAVHAALDLVLRRKAIGAEALAAQRDAVLGGQYPELEPKLKELTTLRMQIAQKTLAGPGPEGLQTHQKLLAEWNVQKERLESELAHQILEMNLEQKLRDADRQAVARAMPPSVALVELVRFNVFDFKAVLARGESQWKPARYLAFVLPAGEPDNVQMVDLGEAEPIDRLIAAFRASITGEDGGRGGRDLGALPVEPDRVPGTRDGSALRAAIFGPLLATFGDCKRLLLAPDGDLTRLPFEILPMGNSHRLIDEYHISYLGAGRDVLRFGAESSGYPTEALVAADPDFDLAGETGTASQDFRASEIHTLPQPKKGLWSRLFGRRSTALTTTADRELKQQPHPVGTVAHLTSSRQSRDLDRSHLHFGRLPGTRVEGENIATMLGVQPWLEGTALEARLKACRSPRILHLATHGFFLADRQRDPSKELRDLGAIGWQAVGSIGRLSGSGLENPLLRSGLALAGANTWLKGDSLPLEAEDGILTAEDVSGLDLLATELVVLSACETGLGEVRTGEGVFGLRRAFVLAGAKTLVMSLWKVPDLATAVLMDRLYHNLLTRKLARDEALREAQVSTRDVTVGWLRSEGWLSAEMIERLAAGDAKVKKELTELAQQPDDHRPFSHPLYWGAFICQGDPSSLPQPT